MNRSVVDLAVLAPDPSGAVTAPSLIELEAAPDERLLPRARDAVRTTLGVDRPALELFVPDVPAGSPRVPSLLVLEPGPVVAPRDRGLDGRDLDPLLAARAADWTAELAGAQPTPPLRAAWARPGWAARTGAWLDRHLELAGRPRSGPLEQQRTWSLSTLLRTETATGAAWLKSCMPRFHVEPLLGGWLSATMPDAVPGVIAVEPADRIILLDEMDGPTGKEAGGEEAVPEAPAALARIARTSADRVGELRALGLHDRPLAAVPGLLHRVLLGPDALVSVDMAPGRARAVVDWVDQAAAGLGRLGLPPMLVHGDFHAGNVATHRGRLVVFDWSDAVLGHPLMDAAAWLWEAPHDAALATRWETWVDAWSPRVPAVTLRPLLEPVLGVGAAHQLLSLDGILRAMEPALRHSLAWSAVAYLAVLDRLVPSA